MIVHDTGTSSRCVRTMHTVKIKREREGMTLEFNSVAICLQHNLSKFIVRKKER